MLKKIKYCDNNELLQCFDEQGNIIAPQPRRVIHEKPYHIWHAVVNAWVLNNKKEILCTRRSPHVSGNPKKWQTYVGGHVKADSSFLETVKREIAEEIGLKVNENDLRLIEKGFRDDHMHIYQSYVVIFNGDLSDLNFLDSEVSGAQWLRFNEYQKLKTEDVDKWCNSINLSQYKKACKILSL
jgi:isopentenyldiphosphate isomerase